MKKINLLLSSLIIPVAIIPTVSMVSCNSKEKEDTKIEVITYDIDQELGELTQVGGLNKETVFSFNKIAQGYELDTTTLVVEHDDGTGMRNVPFVIGTKDLETTEVYINEDNKGFTIKQSACTYPTIKVTARKKEQLTEIDQAAFISAYTTSLDGYAETINRYGQIQYKDGTYLPQKTTGTATTSCPIGYESAEPRRATTGSEVFEVINKIVGGQSAADITTILTNLTNKSFEIKYYKGNSACRFIATKTDAETHENEIYEVAFNLKNSYLYSFGHYRYDVYKEEGDPNLWIGNMNYCG